MYLNCSFDKFKVCLPLTRCAIQTRICRYYRNVVSNAEPSRMVYVGKPATLPGLTFTEKHTGPCAKELQQTLFYLHSLKTQGVCSLKYKSIP